MALCPYLRIDLSTTREAVTVSLTGEVDYGSRDQLAAVLAQLPDVPAARVEVDLTGLRLLDASGIATLVCAQRTVRQRGGDLYVRHAQGVVARVLAVTAKSHTLTRSSRAVSAVDGGERIVGRRQTVAS